jgi:hypothetical protein
MKRRAIINAVSGAAGEISGPLTYGVAVACVSFGGFTLLSNYRDLGDIGHEVLGLAVAAVIGIAAAVAWRRSTRARLRG